MEGRPTMRNSITRNPSVSSMLGQTAAVELHRDRNSQGFEQLRTDVREAGEEQRPSHLWARRVSRKGEDGG
jgi:hypothetical protein